MSTMKENMTTLAKFFRKSVKETGASFKRTWLLTKVSLRSVDLNIVPEKKRKKKRSALSKWLIRGFLILLGLMAAGEISVSLTFLSIGAFDTLKLTGMQWLLPGLTFTIIGFSIFFLGLFYVTGVFYYAKDTEKLLAMPLTPNEIIMSKFFSVIVFEYIAAVFAFIPLIVYGVKSGAGILYYIYSAAAVILLPVVPLCVAVSVVMAAMRFIKLKSIKDIFEMKSSVPEIMILVCLNYVTQVLGGFFVTAEPGGLSRIVSIGRWMFPGTILSEAALVNGTWASLPLLIMAVLTCVVAVIMMLQIGRDTYFKMVTSVTHSARSRKVMDGEKLAKSVRETTSFRALMRKDFRMLLRTPIYFLNNLLPALIIPIVFLVSLLTTASNPGDPDISISYLLGTIAFKDPAVAGVCICIAFAGGLFLGSMNGIAASAFSREGTAFNMMKLIPVPYITQVMAKIAVGITVSVAGSLLVVVPIGIYIKMPLVLFLLTVSAASVGAALINFASIFLDLSNPKLNWDSEQKAVKQNVNIMISILGSMFLAFAIVLAGMFLRVDLVAGVLTFCIGGAVLCYVLFVLLYQVCDRLMEKNNC